MARKILEGEVLQGSSDDAAFKQRQWKDYQEMVQQNRRSSEVLIHTPKTEINKRHKVILFGRIYRGKSEEEEQLYQFTHQRIDGVITDGYVPVGFLSSLPIDPQAHEFIFLAIRKGSAGPEFQVSWKNEKEVIAEWDINPDALWTTVLAFFEKKNLLSEESLDYLDADPFVLFGIDDTVTQKALKRMDRQPVLLCRAAKPDSVEWFDYLECNPNEDRDITWVVQAFAETELPTPWTCYKGVGSIVCFINQNTGKTTWKHPFYPYFEQLRDYCKKASSDEIVRIRTNRLIWNYETSQAVDHEPLISPEYIEHLSDIFGYDVHKEPFLVRTLKAYIKVFAHSYRSKEDVEKSDVLKCMETLEEDRERNSMMEEIWHDTLFEEVKFELDKLADGRIYCIECNSVALSFCLECKDYFCLKCFDKIHLKGQRSLHTPFRLIPCSMCLVMPAKLHCTFTDKSLCHECYAMRHIKQLPADAKENPARRINYRKQFDGYTAQAKQEQERNLPLEKERSNWRSDMSDMSDSDMSRKSYESVLAAEWHPFYDSKGIKYYYNFTTGERMRRSPAASPSGTEVTGTPDEFGPGTPREKSTLQPLADAPDGTKDLPPHLILGQSEPRAIRPPHRGREGV